MYCNYCGKRVKPSYKMCPKCHRPLYKAEKSEDAPTINAAEFSITEAGMNYKSDMRYEQGDTSPVKLMIDVLSKRVERNDKRIKKSNAQFIILWILIILSFCFSAIALFIAMRK